ncbi:MAG: 50S ribosomal protein L6 [Candidatus Woesearchaeota archaeon]
MKKENFMEKIAAPEGVTVAVNGTTVSVSGSKGEVTKIFRMPRFSFSVENNALVVSCKKYSVYDRCNFMTLTAHLSNMFTGVQEGYEYELKICSSHFPMTVAVSGDKLTVKNLLGEKVPRVLTLKKGVEVKVNGDIIVVSGVDVELVSQVAADIEQLTRITDRDRRIFQDGIYITKKAGVPV